MVADASKMLPDTAPHSSHGSDRPWPMQFPQLVPTVQWPELAACSFSWCYEKQFQMRTHLRGGLNTLHIPQLVQLFSGLKLAARSLQPVL
jgi:hypothetical protein